MVTPIYMVAMELLESYAKPLIYSSARTSFNTIRPEQNDHCFVDIFKQSFLNENVCILIKNFTEVFFFRVKFKISKHWFRKWFVVYSV